MERAKRDAAGAGVVISNGETESGKELLASECVSRPWFRACLGSESGQVKFNMRACVFSLVIEQRRAGSLCRSMPHLPIEDICTRYDLSPFANVCVRVCVCVYVCMCALALGWPTDSPAVCLRSSSAPLCSASKPSWNLTAASATPSRLASGCRPTPSACMRRSMFSRRSTSFDRRVIGKTMSIWGRRTYTRW